MERYRTVAVAGNATDRSPIQATTSCLPSARKPAPGTEYQYITYA